LFPLLPRAHPAASGRSIKHAVAEVADARRGKDGANPLTHDELARLTSTESFARSGYTYCCAGDASVLDKWPERAVQKLVWEGLQ
jgi:hypothetical protein